MNTLLIIHCALWSASSIYMFNFYVKDEKSNQNSTLKMLPPEYKGTGATMLFLITLIMSVCFGFLWFLFNPIIHPMIINVIDKREVK